jgi:type III pantothenate kinase
MQSGLYYGYLGLVDGILELLLGEMGKDCKIVATGGLSSLFGGGSKYIKAVDDFLTLDGLRIIWERNQAGKPREGAASVQSAKPDSSKPWPVSKSGSKSRR